MVDVGAKAITRRHAVVAGELVVSARVIDALTSGSVPKGDPLAIARIAGIQAAKQTAALIPMCHNIPLDHISVECRLDAPSGRIEVRAEVSAEARTGVEMEAMCAASVALLTLYDMLKSVDKGMEINALRLLEKSGGRSGTWIA